MRETLVAWRELVALPGWKNLGSGSQFFGGETRIDSSNDCAMCPTGHSPLTTSQWTLRKGQELNQLEALWNSTGSSCTHFTTYIFTRVNGNLALSRAMGDFVFKMNDKLSQVF